MLNYKIYIIGASGTGKTTLAKALSVKLQCVHFDSDDFYHYPTDPPFLKQRSGEARARLLSQALDRHSSWILSGGAGTWEPSVKLDPSLVIFLYLPPNIRLERLKERESTLYGKRIQQGGDMESIHKEFIEWTEGYDSGQSQGTNLLSAHLEYLKKLNTPLVKFEKPMTTKEQIDFIIKRLK